MFFRIKDIYLNIKWFFQRGKRGYSDCDVWDFDNYLSNVIIKGLKDLHKQIHGVPGDLADKFKDQNDSDSTDIAMIEWKKIIKEIIWTFETSIKIQNHDWLIIDKEKDRKQIEKNVKILNTSAKEEDKLFKDLPDLKYYLMTKEDMKRYKQGWKYFQQYYFNLWN